MAIVFVQARSFPDQPDEVRGVYDHRDSTHDDDPGDEEEDASDTSSILEEVRPEECPSYFLERHGRLFSSISHGGLYPLPVDAPEQERLRLQHNVLRQLLGANYLGPVPQLLAAEQGRQKRALDLCTGTGTWVTDMAREFPHVRFSGIDIVPIASRYPPHNVIFEMHDVNERLRWRDNVFDFVHARDIAMVTRNISGVLREVARVLLPGGLFLSCEWVQCLIHHMPSHGVTTRIREFFDAVTSALQFRGLEAIALPNLLASTGNFRDITTQVLIVPLGGWHPDARMRQVGAEFKEFVVQYAYSMMPILLEAGLGEGEVDELVKGLRLGLGRTPGSVGVYHIVHARKV